VNANNLFGGRKRSHGATAKILIHSTPSLRVAYRRETPRRLIFEAWAGKPACGMGRRNGPLHCFSPTKN